MARNTTPKAAMKPAKKPAKKKAGKPKPWTPAEVEEAFRRFKKASPAPETELQYVNPYTPPGKALTPDPSSSAATSFTWWV